MPFEFEYLLNVQRTENNGFKLHYVIPKQYFEGKPELFENFLSKILMKKDENDFVQYAFLKDQFESPEKIVDYLKSLKCDKLTDESYFMTVKHYVIQEYKQFNRIYKQIRGLKNRLNGEDVYTHISKKHLNLKECLDDLVKSYIDSFALDFNNLIDFSKYNEENIYKLHTDILLKLSEHEKDYNGVCFEIVNLKSDDKVVEDKIYYKFANKVSTRILKIESKKKESESEDEMDRLPKRKGRKMRGKGGDESQVKDGGSIDMGCKTSRRPRRVRRGNEPRNESSSKRGKRRY